MPIEMTMHRPMLATEADSSAAPSGAVQPSPKYDGFISYSHEVDRRLAPAIQRALHTLAETTLTRYELSVICQVSKWMSQIKM